MFEDKKWSKELMSFAIEIYSRGVNSTKEEFIRLLEMALEEGRQEVLDDPRTFELVSKDEAHEREPTRDESRD